MNDPAHDQHGDDAYAYGLGHGHDDSHFGPSHAPTASDAPSNEHHGYSSQQEHIDAYRAEYDHRGAQRLDLGHPQDRVAAADQHARSNRETGGKPYDRRRS
jgi:hypothetical protein